jgi:hypothetical protein
MSEALTAPARQLRASDRQKFPSQEIFEARLRVSAEKV